MGANGSPDSPLNGHAPRSRQDELRRAQDDLDRQTALLLEQANEVERAKCVVKEKAERLSGLSMYRSDFIAEVSHALRTPLNTVLILAEQLEGNQGETMTVRQVEYATVIRAAGADLLKAVDGLLSVAKVESGTINAEPAPPPEDEPRSRMPVRRRFQSVDEDTFKGAKVFLVDDEFKNVFAMKALLERGSAVVSFAESGETAIEMLEDGLDVDVVLMDINMPGLNGYDTIRAIRAMDVCKDLPLIAVTVQIMAGERKRCLDAGANDYVPKPVDTSELVKAISPWLPRLVAAAEPGI